MKKLIFLIIISFIIIGCGQNEVVSFDENSTLVIEEQVSSASAVEYEVVNEIEDKETVQQVIEIFKDIDWQNKEVNMIREADYKLNNTYHIWLTPQGDMLEIVNTSINNYARLPESDSEELYTLLTGKELGRSDANNEITGEMPPEAVIEIENESYETILGAYCWSGNGQATCVDTAGPKELLKEKEPINVKPGEKIIFMMEYEPKPNEFDVLQISESDEEVEVSVHDNTFTAPSEEGVYYYSYGAWWMDEQEENASNGDAFYNFVIEVE